MFKKWKQKWYADSDNTKWLQIDNTFSFELLLVGLI